MTVVTTDNFGFIGVYNATPSTKDWACTYWNWIAVDAILYGLVSHTHDGAAALQNPTGTLSLNTAETGGYLPANTAYYIGITYVDDLLRETAISTIANITTGTGISTPSTPTINDDATPTDIQECVGGLTGGDYWYKISYVKDGGETLPSSPVYVQIPTDTTYECTIHFVSLTEAANDADAIYIYRKIGNTGSYVKLAEITAGSTSSYTDDNTGVPTCDKAPVISSTITSFSTITIDWSALDFTDAAYVKIYATTTSGTWPTNALVATVTMNQATPVDSYLWNGTARTAGKPPEVTQCFNNPPKIVLDTEVQGNLPWTNLPSDFTWEEPVADYASLPSGDVDGEVRLALDSMTLYSWDEDISSWVTMSGGGLSSIVIPYGEEENPLEDYLPTDGLEDGQIAIVQTSTSPGEDDYAYRTSAFQYHASWSTPGWSKLALLPVVPNEEYFEDSWYPMDEYGLDSGSAALIETTWGTYMLMVGQGEQYDPQNGWWSELPLNEMDHQIRFGFISTYELTLNSINSLQELNENFNPTDTESLYYDACNHFLDTNTYAAICSEKTFAYWNGTTWETVPTFKFRGSGDTLPTVANEEDVFIENGIFKKATLSSSRNLLLSEAQAGFFRTPPATAEGWDVYDAGGSWPPNMECVYAAQKYTNTGSTYKVYLTIFSGNAFTMTDDYAIPVTTGTEYTFSFYIYGKYTTGTQRVQFLWLDSSKNLLDTTSGEIYTVPTEDYPVRIERSSVAIPNAAYCKIRITNVSLSSSSYIYISQIQFEENSSATDYISPEYDWKVFGGYIGAYDTYAELEEVTPEYGNGSNAFCLEDTCWYWYDDGATPTWIKQSDILTKQEAIEDIVEDATPTAEQLKINEILAALRAAGIIES